MMENGTSGQMVDLWLQFKEVFLHALMAINIMLQLINGLLSWIHITRQNLRLMDIFIGIMVVCGHGKQQVKLRIKTSV